MRNICCFAGHGKLTYTDEIFYRLKAEIEKVIREEKITEFWVGNYGAFDRLAARAVREVKKDCPHIRLNLILPYLTVPITKNRKEYADLYDNIILAEMPEKTPKSLGIIKCNQYMVQKSAVLICFVSHTFGGAAETVAYARKKGRKVFNLG